MSPVSIFDYDSEEEFLRQNVKDWQHGIQMPRTVIQYERSNFQYNDKIDFKSTNEIIFAPHGSFQELEMKAGSKNTKVTAKDEKEEAREDNVPQSIQESDERKFFFSGYSSVPEIALNVTGAFEKSEKTKNHKETLPKLCCQNKFEYNDSIYVFGGMHIAEDMSLSEIGIPDDTDLSKISVHIPSELPPYFHRSLLSNPFFVQNTIFWLHNPLRGTLTAIDVPDFGDFPSHINFLVGCQISDSHFFFYGGFSFETDSIEYLEKIDRYVINKRIVMNDDGYILDVMTLKFTKIELKTSDEKDTKHKGRFGCAVTAYRNDNTSEGEVTARAPSPPAFTDNSSIDSEILHNSSNDHHQSNESLNKPVHKGESKPNTSASISLSDFDQTGIKDKQKLKSQSSKERLSSPKLEGLINVKKNSIFSQSSSSHQRQSPISGDNNHKFIKMSLAKKLHKKTKSIDGNNDDECQKEDSSNTLPATTEIKPKLQPIDTTTNIHISNGSISSAMSYIDCNNASGLRTRSSSDTADSVNKVSSLLKDSTSRNLFFNKSVVKPGYLNNIVFIFGGFQEKDDCGRQEFVPTNDLTRIDLQYKNSQGKVKFLNEAYLYSINDHQSSAENSNWPSPRGCFAFSLINSSRKIEDNCQIKLHRRFDETESRHESSGIISPSTAQSSKIRSSETFFAGKSLVIHGGVNEDGITLPDLFVFDFDSGTWSKLNTYAYDYFDNHQPPNADENIEQLSKDKEITSPELVEAEMRACFHSTLYYRNEEHDYLFFVGGFRNDYLRHFEPEIYVSSKIDVSRLARFQFDTSNSNTERFAVLNLQTQTWEFVRYYSSSSSIVDNIDQNFSLKPYLKNSRISNFSGVVSLIGKNITLSHGLTVIVPERSDEFEDLKTVYPIQHYIWGGIVSFTFPSL